MQHPSLKLFLILLADLLSALKSDGSIQLFIGSPHLLGITFIIRGAAGHTENPMHDTRLSICRFRIKCLGR
jgi:hypothetical protein